MSSVPKLFLSYLLLFLLPLFMLAGSSEKARASRKEAKQKEDAFVLYYLNKNENGLKKLPAELEDTEDTEDTAEEILKRLQTVPEDQEDICHPSIPDDILIDSVSLKKGTLSIDFESSYKKLARDQEILLRASICKTLLQLEDIDAVVFTVEGNSLIGSDDTSIGHMAEDSFILDRDALYEQSDKVTLYYANDDGNRLVPVEREVRVSDNMPLETGMLNELIHQSGPEGTRNPLPRDLVINRTQVYNNICYVDLSSKIEEIMPDVEDRIKLYAMVNTLVNRGIVSQVQFTVDGKPMKALNDIEGFDQPMSCDYSLSEPLKKKRQKNK